jgi:hypothetical protein
MTCNTGPGLDAVADTTNAETRRAGTRRAICVFTCCTTGLFLERTDRRTATPTRCMDGIDRTERILRQL